jgi:hypothetical protein
MIVIFCMFAFILIKINAPVGFWSFAFSIPLMIGAFVLSNKLWNDRLKKIVNAEFRLTADSLVQEIENNQIKKFMFSEIAVVDKQKFGTTIVKGNRWTKIDYYRPKKFSPYQIDSENVIFIPSITTNYTELVETIVQRKRLS